MFWGAYYGAVPVTTARSCAAVCGYNVHAGVCVAARNRLRLERILRYAGRPPVCSERPSLLPDGRLLYRLKHRWRDGTTHMIFEPLELVEKLAALVPPPRFNLVRYHGVLAPSATFRPLIIPESESSASPAHPNCSAKQQDPAHQAASNKKNSGCRPRNYSWSELMKRIFAVDVLECTRCGGRMRILCAIHPSEAIRRILDCLGLPSRPPPVAPVSDMDDPWIC